MEAPATPMFDKDGAVPAQAAMQAHEQALEALQAIGLDEGFRHWLEENWHIWDRFRKLSDQMRLKGRKYYAARTVIEVMRWHYHLRDVSDKAFIHNNNHTPKMARLYNAVTGVEFFQLRERGGRVPLEPKE